MLSLSLFADRVDDGVDDRLDLISIIKRPVHTSIWERLL